MKAGLQFGLVLWLAAGLCAAQDKTPNRQAARPAPAPRSAPPPKSAAPRNPAPAAPRGENLKKAPGSPRLNAPGASAVERLLAMPPEQRERMLEKLPAAQQENLRKRFEKFDQRPPEERARLIDQWKRLESLSPERRQLLTRQMQAFNALPDERRVVLWRAVNQLGRMTPEEREARLASEPFKNRYSPTELQMLSDLAENYPFPKR